MKTSHTPGPWYDKCTGAGQGLIISETDGRNVAIAYDERDARLIAAAPELLEALSELSQHVDKEMSGYWTELTANLMQQARATIAKAKGETQ